MSDLTKRRLRVLVADGHRKQFHQIAQIVERLGHSVLRVTELVGVGNVARDERADVAIVVVGSVPMMPSISSTRSSTRRRAQ